MDWIAIFCDARRGWWIFSTSCLPLLYGFCTFNICEFALEFDDQSARNWVKWKICMVFFTSIIIKILVTYSNMGRQKMKNSPGSVSKKWGGNMWRCSGDATEWRAAVAPFTSPALCRANSRGPTLGATWRCRVLRTPTLRHRTCFQPTCAPAGDAPIRTT